MSKRSKARRNDLIRSMEGLSVLKVAPESKPAAPAPAQPKPGKPMVRYAIGLMAGIVFVAAGFFVLR
jgi:hypothetical protein